MTFAQFAASVIERLKEAQDATDVPGRIIALGKLRAGVTDYMGEIGPQHWAEYSAMQSQAVGAAKKQSKSAKSQAVETGNLF